MSAQKMFQLAKDRLKTAALAGLLLGALSFMFLVMTQKNFRANTDFLIVQNQEGFSDYYALSRSADYLGGIITESIYSEKFLDEVTASGKVSSVFITGDKVEKLKKWKRIIKVGKSGNVGIAKLAVLSNSQKEALEISEAVTFVLTTKCSLFLGQNQKIDVRILSGPIVEKNPSFSQILGISLGGFIIGALLALLWAMYREEYFTARNEIEFTENKVKSEEVCPLDDNGYWEQRLKEDFGK